MKVKICILSILLIVLSSADAQSWQWGRRCGGAPFSSGSDEDKVHNIVTDKNGNTYSLLTMDGTGGIRALATSNNIPGDDLYIPTYGMVSDVVIVSYSRCGNLRWYKVIGNANSGQGIGIDSNANIYITFITSGHDLHIGSLVVNNLNNAKMFTAKFDSLGNYQWAKYANSDTSKFNDRSFYPYLSTTTAAGDTYIFCHTDKGVIVGNTSLITTNGYHILKYNSSGIPIELTKLDMSIDTNVYIQPNYCRFHKTNSGKYFLKLSLDLYSSTVPNYFGNQIVRTSDVIGCFDKNGSFLWKIDHADSAKGAGGMTYWDEDSKKLYISGAIQKGETYLGHTATNKVGYLGKGLAFVACVDTLGNKIWLNQAYQNGFNAAGSFLNGGVVVKNQKFITGGYTGGTVDWGGSFKCSSPTGSVYGYIAAFDINTGNILQIDSVKDVSGFGDINVFTADTFNNVYSYINYRNHLFVGSQDMYLIGGYKDICIAKWGFADCAVTPLKFTNYTVANNSSGINNIWQTANEINVSHYNIERSFNGNDFTIIGKVKANNKSSNEYRFEDNVKTEELIDRKTVYYRVVGVDYDGRKTYSTIKQITLKPQAPNNVFVFPNPAKDVVHIESKEPIKQLLIIDFLGKEVSKSLVNSQSTYKLTINNHQLAKGLYVVQVTTLNGNVFNEKLVVQ